MCLSVILIDSVYRTDKARYPQEFSEEYKYFLKEKKISNNITDDTNISSDDSDREEYDYSDDENSNE